MLAYYVSMVETDDEKSFIEELYIKYERDMYNAAHSILHNGYDAEDAVHEAFLRIIKNIDRMMRIPADERSYYAVIISRNTAIDIFNKRKKQNEFPLEEIDDLEDVFSIGDIVDSNLGVKTIQDLLSELEETDFEVLYMNLICEFTPGEIAAVLNIKPGAARQRLYKAKSNFRKLLEKENYNG